MPDRQFDAILERLDRIAGELARLNRHAENNALAYAALGQSPRVRHAK